MTPSLGRSLARSQARWAASKLSALISMPASSFVAVVRQIEVSFAAVAPDTPSAKDIKKRLTWHLGIYTCFHSLGLLVAGGASPGVGADGGSRTRTGSPPQDFKSCVSTSSTTSARCDRQATVPEILALGNVTNWRCSVELAPGLLDANSGRPKRKYSEGTTKRVSSVEVTRPPKMTMAVGSTISCPGTSPMITRGTSPRPAVDAVTRIGAKRSWRREPHLEAETSPLHAFQDADSGG